MDTDSKAYEMFWELFNSNDDFNRLVRDNLDSGKIRFFGTEEWDKINSQNFIPNPDAPDDLREFIDMFRLGYNIGNCVGTAKQLSYSYNNVDIVSGILPILKGTLNAEKEGGHCWLETPSCIIDTSLMLIIDKSLRELFGYHEEQRLTAEALSHSSTYMARKAFVNDASLRSNKKI